MGFLPVLRFPPASGRWTGYSRLLLGVNECVHAARDESRMYSHLTPGVRDIGFESTVTRTRMKLLKMTEWTRTRYCHVGHKHSDNNQCMSHPFLKKIIYRSPINSIAQKTLLQRRPFKFQLTSAELSSRNWHASVLKMIMTYALYLSLVNYALTQQCGTAACQPPSELSQLVSFGRSNCELLKSDKRQNSALGSVVSQMQYKDSVNAYLAFPTGPTF